MVLSFADINQILLSFYSPLERIFDVLKFLNRLQGLFKYLSVSGSLKNFIEPGVSHMGTSATGFRTRPVDIDQAVIYWK